MANQLADFIRAKTEKSAASDVNWQAKKDAWVGSVNFLYSHIINMLEGILPREDARTFNVEVTEDIVGTYSIPVLELKIGTERVEFRPKGLTVLGVEGRVDLLGAAGSVTFLVEAPNHWYIVAERVPKLKMLDLTPEALQYALERVMLP